MFNKTKEDLDFNSWLEILKIGLQSMNCRKDTINEFYIYAEENYNSGYSVYVCLDTLVYFNKTLDW